MKRKYKYLDITLGTINSKQGICYEIYLYVIIRKDKPIKYIQMLHYATKYENMQTSLFEMLSILQDLSPYAINIISGCNFDNVIDKIKDFEKLTGIHVTYDVITRFEKDK